MPNITLSRACLAPNHPEDRRTASTYMSYVKRWAREERASFLPHTMAPWRNTWANICRTSIFHIVDSLDGAYNMLHEIPINGITNIGNLRTPQDKLVFIQFAMNAVAHIHGFFGQRVKWKIDYILPLGPNPTRCYSPDRATPKFKGRCMFVLGRESYGILDQCIADNQSRAFWDKIISLYRGMVFDYRLAHPRYVQQTTWNEANRLLAVRRERNVRREQNHSTSSVSLGRHEGDPSPQQPEIDIPHGFLAEEYTNRTDSGEMSREEVLRVLGTIPTIPNEVTDIIFNNLTPSDLYDMLIVPNLSEEIA